MREELEFLNIRVQGVMQLRSRRRNQDPAKDHPPTPHFIVSVARGPEVSKVWSLNKLCDSTHTAEDALTTEYYYKCNSLYNQTAIINSVTAGVLS